MSLEIIVKANDGRGRGHIGRVINFVDYDFFRDILKLVVHKGYSDMVPERMICSLVTDEKWRVNLDYGSARGIYLKVGNANHSARKIKMTPHIQKAIANYYFSILDGVGKDTKLIYIDDQNGPETVFPEEIAKMIGIASPGTLKANAPNANVTFEIETQIWNKTGDYAMGETRINCFQKVDYIHLSSDVDFFRSAVGNYSFGKLFDHKIIPMGFPISRYALDLFDSLKNSPQTLRTETEKFKKKISIKDSKKIIYSSFGAGEGANEVYDTLFEAFENVSDDFNLVISNAGELETVLSKMDYSIQDGASKDVKVLETKNGKKVYLVKHPQKEHMKTLAIADILVQGSGSGTTYEAIASMTPSICVPLNRPGYEQIIKGIGVEKSGGGIVLFLNSLSEQVREFKDLTEQDGEMPGRKYDTENLVNALRRVDQNMNYYRGNLLSMRGYFADPLVTARCLLDMSEGRESQQIIRNNQLKSFL